MEKKAGTLPLEGLRVINMGWYWVCTVITHILGDMGAEVIKLDSHQRLEVLKGIPPFLNNVVDPDHALWPHNLSRNNYGITVNLDTQQGRDLLKDLIRETDVIAENWTPGTMKKLGLDYDSLRKVKPDLIMISPSAGGQWGPLSRINTYGQVLSCMAGLDGLLGYEGERPLPFGNAIADPAAGILGAYAVLAALRHRGLTGEGRYIDYSQWEGMTTMLGAPMLDYHWNGRVYGPLANRDPVFVPHNVYPSKGNDCWVSIAVYSDEEWEGLCRGMGNPSWPREDRFADKFLRMRHAEEMDALIARWTRERTHYEAAEALQREGVAAFPAISERELYTDPHFKEREAWVEMEHPLGHEVIYGVHWKFSETPGRIRLPGPMVGQHNQRIFGELLGIPQDELRRLQEEKVIY